MGLLSGEFTEQDLAFDETKLTDPKKFKRGVLADIGLGAVSGVAKGVTSVSNAASRFIEGDEVADKRIQQVNEAFTPLNQGTAGHITSGITEVVSAGAVGAPLGPYGMAATVGLGTRATEHTRLTQQLGVDQDTADTASNIYGATNAALAFLPVSNVFKKSLIADYGALVVAPTAVGQGLIYVEGAYLDHKGYEKQGTMYKDMATDPNAILMNLGIGTTFFAAGRYMNAKGSADLPEAEVHKAEADFNATVEQAQVDADVSSMPNIANTADDLLQHQNNLNQAIEQVIKGEKVNISEATGGQLKTLQDIRDYINNKNSQPINTTSTLQPIPKKIANLGDGMVSNSHLSSLPLKANEAIAGGQIKGYTAEFAQLTNSEFGSNIKYFSSFNDTYHKGSGSRHAVGQAFDVVLKDPSKASQTMKRLQQIAKENGYTVKLLDEYANPSKNATGGHIHVSVTGRTGTASTNNNSSIIRVNINPKALVNTDINVLVRDSYNLAQEVGFSPAQARALIGELGRENNYNLDTMFGTHSDQANNLTNKGIFSWQGTRKIKLENFLKQRGLLNEDGTIKRTNEALKAQFEFLYKEVEKMPSWKRNFLDKKNITNDEARAALGGKGTIIGWARGQDVLKNGDKFDWKAHEATANRYSNMVDGQPTHTVFEPNTNSTIAIEQAPIKPETSYEGTVDRLDLDNLPHINDSFISIHDLNAFDRRYDENEITADLRTEQIELPIMVLNEHGNLVPESEISIPKATQAVDEELNKLLSSLYNIIEEAEYTPIPHTAKGVRVKDNINNPAKEFKPDDTNTTAWKEAQRYEEGKYHKELSRSFKDKDGNTVQELKYRGSYVNRTVDSAGKTISMHVGRLNKSDFLNHKGNKELETALNRIFDTNNYGYLSQIPKGKETISKLEANPNTVISSKRTGEDLNAAQWKDKLQKEQDNIVMMKQAMSTLAKCALKNVAQNNKKRLNEE